MLIDFVAAAGIFLLADFIYAMDHYFVHRNAMRYLAQHRPHHDFYADGRATPLFMPGEFARYTATGLATILVGALLWWQTGVIGFVIGGVLKFAHNYLFHMYQHHWAYKEHDKNDAPMRAGWGIASARYHQFHHDHPNRRPFTYAETWAGWDRILEMADPVLSRVSANHRRARRNAARRSLAAAGPRRQTGLE